MWDARRCVALVAPSGRRSLARGACAAPAPGCAVVAARSARRRGLGPLPCRSLPLAGQSSVRPGCVDRWAAEAPAERWPELHGDEIHPPGDAWPAGRAPTPSPTGSGSWPLGGFAPACGRSTDSSAAPKWLVECPRTSTHTSTAPVGLQAHQVDLVRARPPGYGPGPASRALPGSDARHPRASRPARPRLVRGSGAGLMHRAIVDHTLRRHLRRPHPVAAPVLQVHGQLLALEDLPDALVRPPMERRQAERPEASTWSRVAYPALRSQP